MGILSHKKNSEQSLSGQCLSDLQLAALLEGGLKAKEKQSFLRHINRCSDCRFCWMEASSFIVSPVPLQTRKFSLLGWFRPFHGFSATSRIVAGFAVISLLLLVTFIVQPLQQNINMMLDQQYAQLSRQPQQDYTKQSIENMPLSWEHSALGFSSTYAEASTLAFSAGLWQGRNALSEQLNAPLPKALQQTQNGGWSKSEQNIYYQLRRWFTSLWYAASLNDDDVDNAQQFKILEKFKRELQAKKAVDKDAGKALKSITRLNIILKEFKQNKISHDQLREQLEIMMAILSPVSLEQPS